MTASSAGPLLRAVDRAAFVVAFGERLRRAGVPVTFTALGTCTEALDVSPPESVADLYWLCRVSLVKHAHDLPTFDAVFEIAFRDAVLAVHGQSAGPRADLATVMSAASLAGDASVEAQEDGQGLPWDTLPHDVRAEEGAADGVSVPELLPSAIEGLADVGFDQLDEEQLALVGLWLERVSERWPTRRSRRSRVHPSGRRVALRETIAASRRTGWEQVRLTRTRPVRRPRPLVVVTDVSASMQPYASAYLHLMRALARSGRAETFAFSTSLTRVTPALRHHSARVAMEQATADVADRYGGTHLARSLHDLLRSRHGNVLRGGVLVVASDGWDSDDPERLAAVLSRVRLRVHRVVWLNPRVAAPGFQPLVGSMAAALPFCDAFLPAHSVRAVTEALEVVLAERRN
jgi:uncharacterized protein